MNFHSGQLVICIDADLDGFLVKDREYRVKAAGTLGGINVVIVKGINIVFLARRFVSRAQHETVRSMMNTVIVKARLPQIGGGA